MESCPANTAQLLATQLIARSTPTFPELQESLRESWNVAVQQAFRGDLSLQVAYVANHGVIFRARQNINLPSTYGGGATPIRSNR